MLSTLYMVVDADSQKLEAHCSGSVGGRWTSGIFLFSLDMQFFVFEMSWYTAQRTLVVKPIFQVNESPVHSQQELWLILDLGWHDGESDRG